MERDETDKQETILTMLILTPAVVAVLQLLLLLTVFRIDTPIFYHQKGDAQKMREALKYVYKPYAIENKADEILQGGSPTAADGNEEGEAQEAENVGYQDICCNPLYSKATIIGLLMAVF